MQKLVTTFVLCSISSFAKAHPGIYCEPQPPELSVGYHVWYNPNTIGNDHLSVHQNVQIDNNSTFYQVMLESVIGEYESRYRFEAEEFPFGNQVTSIGGYSEDMAKSWHWMLFQYPNGEEPNPQLPPPHSYLTALGVDGKRVLTGETYLFWRKHVNKSNKM